MFHFVRNRLKTQDKIGGGGSRAIFPYQKDPDDRKWIVKKIYAKGWEDLSKSLSEVVYGFSGDHPSIVPVKGYYIEKELNSEAFNIYLKLPRMKQTLRDNFKARKDQNKPYSQEEIIRYFYSLICGIEYLHSKKIFRRDMKPDKLLLDYEEVLKISGIGTAKHVEDADQSHYSAPEMLGPSRQDIKKSALGPADIWSLGVVMLELCVFDENELLFSLSSKEELTNKVCKLLDNAKGEYDISLKALIKKMLSFDPSQRPAIGEIKAELEEKFGQYLVQFEVKKSLFQKQEQKYKDRIKVKQKPVNQKLI